MSIKITFKKNISNKLIKNYVLFSNDDFKINALNSLLLKKIPLQLIKLLNHYILRIKILSLLT